MKLQIRRLTDPDRTEVRDSNKKFLAMFTDGAYTVTLKGPRRTFAESTAADSVIHSVWVRTLPKPFVGNPNAAWLVSALQANARKIPDVLAIAMQYVAKAPPIFDGELQIAGDAGYGPLIDGAREEGSDFNDYLGIPWQYPEQVDKPEKRQFGCLDCSGFLRMVWGYRHHLSGSHYHDTVPLALNPEASHHGIPRRSFEIYDAAPGILIIADSGVQVVDFASMNIGDLAFFDADDSDGTQIDHVGIYLGRDAGGHHRFVSSRKGANGPTMGDYRGKSILDGSGLYATAFRAVRRL
jgi:cell wall-associated NlpC family hydrolase